MLRLAKNLVVFFCLMSISTYGYGILKRTPAFDALVTQLLNQQYNHVALTSVDNNTTVKPNNKSYNSLIKKLNQISVIYFAIRLGTYDMVHNSKLGKTFAIKENFILKKLNITKIWLYKLTTIAIETLILKTIIKSGIYIGMHDAFDATLDSIKRLFKIILSIMY